MAVLLITSLPESSGALQRSMKKESTSVVLGVIADKTVTLIQRIVVSVSIRLGYIRLRLVTLGYVRLC